MEADVQASFEECDVSTFFINNLNKKPHEWDEDNLEPNTRENNLSIPMEEKQSTQTFKNIHKCRLTHWK